ncbi:hypothetical protein [Schlesneria paludicola]|uniref:hypothetical protein n=1 Tax=Schlesneria paludicola TaxID=360056 RepID=UPI0002D7D484|nr:hypothetical protein [Schlesneria paludicola]
MRIVATMLSITLACHGLATSAEPNLRAQTRWVTADQFRQELAKPFGAKLDQADLRLITSQISETRQIAILLDRRLDPSAEHQFEVNDVSLDDALRQIAASARAKVTLLENAVFLGPEPATRKLRTLIELRMSELQSTNPAVAERRRKELKRRSDITWSNLDTPREILTSLTKHADLKIRNPDLIPHDLWAAGILPNATLIEALSLVLIQFDLTFRWLDKANSIELIPVPDVVSIQRKIRPHQSPLDAMEQLRQQFPNATISPANSELVVTGTVEEHEAISKWLVGNPQQARRVKKEPLKDVKQRLFTFSVPQPVPLAVVMQKLEESDIRFEYDPDAFAAAGIDLQQLVDVNVVNASAELFFRKVFEPARVDFELDRRTVKLKPQSSRPPKNEPQK